MREGGTADQTFLSPRESSRSFNGRIRTTTLMFSCAPDILYAKGECKCCSCFGNQSDCTVYCRHLLRPRTSTDVSQKESSLSALREARSSISGRLGLGHFFLKSVAGVSKLAETINQPTSWLAVSRGYLKLPSPSFNVHFAGVE